MITVSLSKLSLAALAALLPLSTSALFLDAQSSPLVSPRTYIPDPVSIPDRPLPGPITAGPRRPANVPEDYVVTPFGFFHPSCVQSIATDETLLADGRIQRKDGVRDATAPLCKFPRYTHDGSPVTAAKSNPQVNGWIESASIVPAATNGAYSSLLSLWTVPPAPHADDGQLLYYFPGLEDITHTQSILQPVMQWYAGQWAVANWNCCLNNITTESTVISVSPGDKIYGSMTANCPPGVLHCATWTIFSLDLRSGESTTLKNTPSAGQTFNWAFGAVMEPYYVVACNDYPPNHKLDFEVLVFDEDWRLVVSPPWAKGINTMQTPQCDYGIIPTPYDVTITY